VSDDEQHEPKLEHYRRKRSADRTGEPFDAPSDDAEPTAGAARLFVVQKHAARRLHWDLRLEMGGVLRSWAVPRGPSLDPADKRLAVETEDHPLDYVDFEGVIPAGNYGAGAMIVWDRGVWIPQGSVKEGYADGKLLFELQGHKLRGVWTLVRTKGEDDRAWLLLKKPDAAASSDAPAFDESSVLSGLTIEELREGNDRAKRIRGRLEQLDAPSTPVDIGSVQVMKAQNRKSAFTKPDWIFELKYDGYRLLAGRDGSEVRLCYRSGIDATHAFPEIVRTLRALPFERFVLDAEVVVLDGDGRPNFQRLQRRALLTRSRDVERAMREHPVTVYAFDLLGFEDFDLRKLPLLERKEQLRQLLPRTGALRYTDHVVEQGEALLEQVRRLGLEGIMAKKADSTYHSTRSSSWLKIRIEQTDDFVIVGFTLPEGNSRTGFSALHLATHREGTLTYVGKVGTGFDESQLRSLRATMDELVRHGPAFAGAPPHGSRHVWIDPEVVCEVRFTQITDDGLLRHPVFLRLRDDKSPDECELQVSPSHADAPDEAPAPPAKRSPPSSPRTVTISNPDKVFWPDEGYTKADLVEYYRRISPWLLPYLRDRPLVLTRYPDGIAGKSFFQKNAPPYVPDWVRTKTMWSEHAQREIEYFVCDDLESLLYVVNMASIPLHVWGARLADLQHPDWAILDLDPKGAPFEQVVLIAQHIHALCERIELPSFPKTSGSTGLHVLVPLGGAFTFAQCRQFAEVLARVVQAELRDISTLQRSMRAREGRVYIDHLQNGHGRLLVSPYCVRPLAGAPVSTPLHWDEVTEALDIRAFDIHSVPARMTELGHDPMLPVCTTRPDLPAVLDRLLPLLQDLSS
jgi:bifunctional non-homologous end joining protein LigD